MVEVLSSKALDNVRCINKELNKDLIQDDEAFDDKFDLILASSVCAFLPNYPETLAIFKSLLKPNGLFIQWDWLLAHENSEETGFTLKQVEHELAKAKFNEIMANKAFEIETPRGVLEALVATGKA